jgi:rSAM/selenodomain-associated transferase 1
MGSDAVSGGGARLEIGVLARAPVAGACKTRLIRLLGAAGAARLQRHLIDHTLATACAAAPGAVTLFTTGDAPDAPWSAWQQRFGVRLVPQVGADLGERMRRALTGLLGRSEQALLIGTDCPLLDVHQLQAAARRLAWARMVFVPAEDGGYVLVGARQLNADAFGDIAWSTARVMQQTRDALRASGWRSGHDWAELPALWDIDRPADLQRAMRAGLIRADLIDPAGRGPWRPEASSPEPCDV